MMNLLDSISPEIKWLIVFVHGLLLFFTVLKILLDTTSTSKTLAYLLLIFLLPGIGMFIYYSLGVNYRHKHFTAQERGTYALTHEKVNQYIRHLDEGSLTVIKEKLGYFSELAHLIYKLQKSNIMENSIVLLENGEVKYDMALDAISRAKNFVHIEYYDWDPDVIGTKFKDLCIKKAREGVKIRVIYDAYASRKIKGKFVKQMQAEGIEIYPIIKINFSHLANRLNHRDHRKIIIVDGEVGFVGGINIADRYDNRLNKGNWWRDTSVKITGPAVYTLQTYFIIHWNVCSPNKIDLSEKYYPPAYANPLEPEVYTQIIGGGPVYPESNIMLTYFRLFSLAREKLYITNPYLIPNESIINALKSAALAGVDVRLMVPEKSDSAIVGAASKFYYNQLLESGVKILSYKKGFVHAKTVVCDNFVSIIGTANMDIRSFDLNFEVMSVNYGKEFAQEVEEMFLRDQEHCHLISYAEWQEQSLWNRLSYSIARLISSLL